MANPTGAIDVTEASRLNDVTYALAGVAEVAVDVEADSMHHFRARLCFVQLGTTRDIFLLDTLAEGVKVEVLQPMFGDAQVTKFFHAAQGDLTYLAEAGVRVRGLFDTHRAATLLGWPKVGLADLVLEKCGMVLKKEHQQADFSVRPLPGELREYIADDVRYLVEVGRHVREACEKADILEEVLLDCDRMCDEATVRPDPLSSFNPKIPKSELKNGTLALAWHIAQRLNTLRHAWAEAEDVPTGRMLSNMAVVAISTRLPDDGRALLKCAGVRGAFARVHGDEVLGVVKELVAASAAGTLEAMPDKGKDRDPKKKKREDALLAWRKERATERKVTPSVILPNSLVEDLSRTPPKTLEQLQAVPYLGAKRVRLYGAQLLAVLEAA